MRLGGAGLLPWLCLGRSWHWDGASHSALGGREGLRAEGLCIPGAWGGCGAGLGLGPLPVLIPEPPRGLVGLRQHLEKDRVGIDQVKFPISSVQASQPAGEG